MLNKTSVETRGQEKKNTKGTMMPSGSLSDSVSLVAWTATERLSGGLGEVSVMSTVYTIKLSELVATFQY